ncbi:hypothetical protein NDU88_001375 [Pleurodeles waltl]|uniref:Uncharacterized protein n=1 Tax=Pleurodeles waltl TaxID=8319 RepID=A0AAV7USL4_PLEWA|nr:hypothetical protein NDU88_001375 [Pleurodeles waltl]
MTGKRYWRRGIYAFRNMEASRLPLDTDAQMEDCHEMEEDDGDAAAPDQSFDRDLERYYRKNEKTQNYL